MRIKQQLWNQYRFFFYVDIIREVYPNNKIASWVAKVYDDFSIGEVEFYDEEMLFE